MVGAKFDPDHWKALIDDEIKSRKGRARLLLGNTHWLTADQAEKLTENSLSKFEVTGGLVSGTECSRGQISLDRPNRQWDFPFGWAPHQIMAWHGFEKYGKTEVARRLAYRWLYT